MNFYSTYILPVLIDLSMNDKRFVPLRSSLLSIASGTVAEIGFGSGANLPFYPKTVDKLFAIEPSQPLVKRSKKKVASFTGNIETVITSAEEIPLGDNSVDFVVSTFTLCSIPNTTAVLREAKRILRPGGKFLFLEHGLAPEASIQKWQRRLTPIQKRVAGGCHLNRNILGLLADAGWAVSGSKQFYLEGVPKIADYVSTGEATK